MIYRKDVDEARARCLTMGVEFEIEDYRVVFNSDKYILLKYIGDDTEIYLNDIFDEVCVNAFMGRDIKFIDFGTLKTIPNLCFNNCYTLEKVVAHSVNSVGAEVFKNCFSLKSVEFGKVKEIGSRAFSDCVNLNEIIGLEKLEKLGSSAFSNCSSLENLSLDSLRQVDVKAFYNCLNLKEVYFENLSFLSKRMFSNCFNLEKIYTPNVKSIMPCALSGCIKLKELYLNSIGDISIWNTHDALLSLNNLYLKDNNLDIEDFIGCLEKIKCKDVNIIYDE